MVHWGLYALPAGEWRGRRMPTIGEWAQSYFRIENATYGRLAGVFKTWIGNDRVIQQEPVMGGEDFGRYGRTKEKIPICIFWLGTVDPETIRKHQETSVALPSLHSSRYLPLPEPTIKTGVTAMTAAVLDLMAQE